MPISSPIKKDFATSYIDKHLIATKQVLFDKYYTFIKLFVRGPTVLPNTSVLFVSDDRIRQEPVEACEAEFLKKPDRIKTILDMVTIRMNR